MTRYLRQPQVLERVGVSWITIYRLEKLGRFPKRRKLGLRSVGWVESEVEDWCQGRGAAFAIEEGASDA